MGVWATVEQVKQITGFEPTEAQVTQAEFLIELMSGADLDSTTIGTRDRKRLRSAVAYQAVFLDEHPDLLTNVDADIIRQDGVDVDFSHANVRPRPQQAWNGVPGRDGFQEACTPLGPHRQVRFSFTASLSRNARLRSMPALFARAAT
ncbi:hypothetical protein [Nocardiopsis sp. CA-288880]|uniref:hypothetical protein n=1 Tax=Nocardiopsis sp. CA-288880 TaxID=3239995 RepID=UPI003D96484B